MYYTTRFYFPNGIEGEEMKCTFKEFPTLDKAIAYAHRYNKGVMFACCQIENEKGDLVYELNDCGHITDNRDVLGEGC